MKPSAKRNPAARALSPAPVLLRVDTADGQAIRLDRALTIVGSKGHSHLRILSKTISGSHAVLVNLGNNVFLRDLMSRAHTYVNDRRAKECRLKYGDVLRFGELQFRFMDADIVRQSLSSVRSSPAALLIDTSSAPLVLESPTWVIGRHKGADLHLDGDRVSKVHAVIFEQDGVHFIRDLSRDGTRVNGQPARLARLSDSAVIEIGGKEFRYQSTAMRQSGEVKLPLSLAGALPPTQLTKDQQTAAQSRRTEQEQALADPAESAGEQFVFAPEPEILPGPFESNSQPDARLSAPRDFDSNPQPPAETHPEPELWEFDPGAVNQAPAESPVVVDPVDFGVEQVDSADDLETWGITAPLGVTDEMASQPSVDQPPSSPASPIHQKLRSDDPASVATEIESTELPPSRKDHQLEQSALGAEAEWPKNKGPTAPPAEVPKAPTPALSEPIDLATLARPPEPIRSAVQQTPAIAEHTEVRIRPANAAPAIVIEDGAESAAKPLRNPEDSPTTVVPLERRAEPTPDFPSDATGQSATESSMQSGNAEPAACAPLRDLNEILAGGVLQLGSADETDLPGAHRPPRGRLLWVALALVVVTGASIALWFQFGPQLHAFLKH